MSTTQKHTYVALIAWVQGSYTADELSVRTNVFYHKDLIPEYIADNEHVRKYEFQASNDTEADHISKSLFFKDNFTARDSVSVLYSKEEFDEKVSEHTKKIHDFLVILDDGDTYSGSLNNCKVVGLNKRGFNAVECSMRAKSANSEDVLFSVSVGELLAFWMQNKK